MSIDSSRHSLLHRDMVRTTLRRLERQDPRRMLAVGIALGAGTGAAALFGVGGWAGIGLCLLVLGVAVPLGMTAQPVLVAAKSKEPDELREPEELLEMVELPGGTFGMGDEVYGTHEVTVSAFAMSRYPITRGLYREVMGKGPDEWKRDEGDARLPLNWVTWYDAIDFCNALSMRQGLRPCYRRERERVEWDRSADGYRLPTEAEWEYAVRAGTKTQWFFGDNPKKLKRYAWFGEEPGKGNVHPVGEKEPNPWGLHDMIGNVLEWCWDWHGEYRREPAADPTGADEGTYRVLRGGAFWNGPGDLRSADRFSYVPLGRLWNIGFRCVRAARRQPRPIDPLTH